MAAEQHENTGEGLRLLSCYFRATEEDGIHSDSLMLCEVIGEEIQSVSLRVAANAMTRANKQKQG